MNKPPKWIVRLLEWFCPPYLFEGILGDLLEAYHEDIENGLSANRIFLLRTISFFRPGIFLRNKISYEILSYMMFKNNLKIGFRSIMNKKLYSFINAVGLSLAISFSVLIYLFIQDENSFDNWHSSKNEIFRVNSVQYTDTWGFWNGEDEIIRYAQLPMNLGPVLKEEAPEVKMFSRYTSSSGVYYHQEEAFDLSISFIDNDFFKIFDFKIIQGDREILLDKKNSIVITEKFAEKHFNDSEPVGKVLKINIDGAEILLTVTGIIENAPTNTSLKYRDVLVRVEHTSYYEQNLESWTSWNTPLFTLIGKENNREQLISSLETIHKKYIREAEKENSENPQDSIAEDTRPHYEAKSIEEIHLDHEVGWDRVSNPTFSLILTGIGLLILIIACINYITLAMANSETKKIEVGIRKAVGGSKGSLFSRFMTESLLLSFIALLVSILLIYLFTPYFNEFTNKSISIKDSYGSVFSALFLFTLLIGLIAGAYPSIYVSSFKTLKMLKPGSISKLSTKITRPLIIFQFAISCFLIICSMVMLEQMNFISTKDLGYDREQILVVPTNTGWNDEGEKLLNLYKNETKSNPKIISLSGTSSSFNRGWSRNGYTIDGKSHMAYNYRIDPDYIQTLGIEIIKGRDFDYSRSSDQTKSLIVNEALVKDMGWEDPLNEKLNWREDSIGGWDIVGVVKDFHFLSLEHKIEPLFMHLDKNEGKITTILIKISPEEIEGTMDYLETVWKDIAPDQPFQPNFLDEDVERQYQSYTNMEQNNGFFNWICNIRRLPRIVRTRWN